MSDVILFSDAIRDRTRAVHRETEGSAFIAELVEGKRTRDDYVALVGQQYFVYQALEHVAEGLRGDPVAASFVDSKLTRLPAIEADLDFLAPGWRETLVPLAATQRYVLRIHEMAQWAGGFVAHHYTRYLGDLSGGQAIRTLLQRQFGFDTNGVGFYIFTEIAKPKLFKDTYRAQLDAAPWDEAEKDRVIAEVERAFRHNAEMFVDLERATAAVA
ncbi:biliverdin-producing heme oxygenase [Schumannella luteola]|uniref:Heme oxygenase n=1 Tax=Schumannella luteola TaxID=472059 RepID=A0A852YKU9_9MICO|nr:biliverdin-producing heme oxygenase [Schumannella luteola]NYG98359.1 heme oxygenase [Schumannella luteola]TPX05780.1 biliverdin-producing heme oxygenase [Schumannella luteola]